MSEKSMQNVQSEGSCSLKASLILLLYFTYRSSFMECNSHDKWGNIFLEKKVFK